MQTSTTVSQPVSTEFDKLIYQLQDALRSLQDQVNTRTRDLEIASHIAKQVAHELNLDQVLQSAADLTRESFALYHAHIYLLEDDSLVLAAGAGEIGREMVAQGHQIPLDREHSLVARAARTHEGVVINDVRQTPDFMPNPLLPDTRSEMAIPMIAGDHVVGVLDVQADQTNRFTDDDVRIQTTLAAQIAVAVENARTLQQSQKLTSDLALVSKVAAEAAKIRSPKRLVREVADMVAEAFNLYHIHIFLSDKGEKNLTVMAGTGIAPCHHVKHAYTVAIDAEVSLVTDAARQRRAFIANDVTTTSNFLPNNFLPDARAQITIPLLMEEKLLGVIDIQASKVNAFTPIDIQIFETLAAQLSVLLENARSFEEQRRLADIIETSNDIIGTADIDANVTYFNKTARQILKIGDQSLSGTTIADFSPAWATDKIMNEGLPAILAGEVWTAETAFLDMETGEEIPTLQTLVAHRNQAGEVEYLSTVVRDLREQKAAEAELKKRAAELQTVSQISTLINRVADQQKMLKLVSNLTRDRFNLYHAHIYLLEDDVLVLTAGAGETGDKMVELGHQIPLEKEDSLVATAARTGQGVRVNDVTQNPSFMPNPLLPATKSEMAIPLMIGSKVIGVLDVQSDEFDRFTSEDVRIQTTLAAQIAVAVENARTFDEQRRLIDIINSSIDVISSADADGNVTFMNPAGLQMTGLGDSSIEGLRIPDFSPQWASDLITSEGLPETVQKGRWTAETAFLNLKTGEEIPVLQTIIAHRNKSGEIEYFSTVVRDLRDQKAAIHRLEEAQAETERIFSTSIDMIGTANAEGYFLRLNPAWEATLGWSMNELMGQPFIDFVHPDDVEKTLEEASKIFTEGVDTLAFENRYRCKDGSYRWISWKSAVDRETCTTHFVARDVTEEKEAQALIRKRATELETVAKVSASATRILDIDRLLRSVSNLVRDSFELYHAHIYLLDEASETLKLAAGAGEIGREMVARGHRIPLNREDSLVARAARSRRGVIVNDVTQNPNFMPNPLLPDTKSEMAIPMVVGDELVGVLDVQSDIFDRFTTEDIRIKTTLAGQIAVAVENARAFAHQQEVAEQLREVDRLKSEFLANMSHELRTPLNSIIGYSEVLLEGIDGELSEEAREDVSDIHHSGKHLLAIINDILDLAKLEAGQMKIEQREVNILELVDEIARTSQVLVKDKPVELQVQSPDELPVVLGDRTRLRQVILNLVSNAIKFTEEGRVTIETGLHNDHEIFLKVMDTGIGMTSEGLSLIFERFSQVDGSATRRKEGTGLGLTITRELIHMHGGEIYAESEHGAGSTFWFTLPVHVPVAASTAV